jgi:hypothetical protein
LVLLLAFSTALGQRPTDIVQWSAAAPGAVKAGATAKIEVAASIQPGWKLYAVDQQAQGPEPLTFALQKGTSFEISRKALVAPQPKVQKDANFGVDTRYYENRAVFMVPVSVPAAVGPGRQSLPLEITFQVCGPELCLRPFTQKLTVELTVRR